MSDVSQTQTANIDDIGTDVSQELLNNLGNQVLDETLIREYLLDNPDFFNRYPELLIAMRLQHNERGAVSLVERKQELLRQRISQLEEEITSLMNVAKHNERIFNVNHELSFKMLACEDLASLRQLLSFELKKEFGFPQVRLITIRDQDSELANICRNRIFNNYYFGRLTQSESQRLFGNDVGSVALTTFDDPHGLVLFAIASHDPAHFYPEMDSLLFSQIRRLLAHLLPKF